MYPPVSQPAHCFHVRLQFFLTSTAAAGFFFKVRTIGRGGQVLFHVFFFSPSRVAAQTTNCCPVLFPGVHAEAGPVPAELLSGPVPAAAPQEGPHAAQVHRGRNVRGAA